MVPAQDGAISAGMTIAGKYTLESIIGEGGMGAVWRAHHRGLHRDVAVKIISPVFAKSAEARRRFDNEAKAAARLRSRHVVEIFDNGELADGTPYIVMELLEGESLSARLQRGRLSLLDAGVVLAHAGRALDRAHAAGIIHRDIKPDNIFLSKSHDDDGIVVKVLDFGIAKVRSLADDPSSPNTRTGTMLGTPLYMSPEQARDLRTVDHRSDLYSLGVVAYTMLTGQAPFHADALAELLVRICMQPFPSVRAVVPSLPAAVDEWVLRACAKEAAHRFGTARELVDAFQLAAGLVAGPGADSSGHRISPRASGAELAYLPTESAPRAGAPLGPSRSLDGAASTRPTLEQLPRSRAGRVVAAALALTLLVFAGVGLFAALRQSGVQERGTNATTGASEAPSARASSPTETLSLVESASKETAVPPLARSAAPSAAQPTPATPAAPPPPAPPAPTARPAPSATATSPKLQQPAPSNPVPTAPVNPRSANPSGI